MSIGTWQFRATVPRESWLAEAHKLLAKMRVDDLLGNRTGMENDQPPLALMLDLASLDATTVQDESLIRTTSSESHLYPDPGNFVFAGVHNLGKELGTHIAFTERQEPDMQNWFWPLTGAIHPMGNKLVDGLFVDNHVVIALPSRPGKRQTATLIVPTGEDAGTLDMYMTKAETERLGNRNFMPTTWVLETLIKGLRPND